MAMQDDGAHHKDHVRSHYDAHAQHSVPTRQALEKRRQGAAHPLKVFHNDIKKLLLLRFCKPGDSLLDLCCGRGGDIHKWKEAGVHFVHGVDISPNELAEAAKRFRELQEKTERQKRGPLQLEAQFEVCNSLGDQEFISDAGPFDVVTCMFAMHYFFEKESKLRMFLRSVSKNLKPGGYFIGTIPDGKRILWHLAGRQVFDSRMLRLEKRWQGNDHEISPFGLTYLWTLRDTVTDSAGQSEGSLEFLTFITPIVRMAAHYGLEPVFDYEDQRLDAMFEPEDQVGSPFKHFCPSVGFEQSDPSLMVASSCFMAFVFRKLPEDAGVPELIPPLPKQLALQGEYPAAEDHGHDIQQHQDNDHDNDNEGEDAQQQHDEGDVQQPQGEEQEEEGSQRQHVPDEQQQEDDEAAHSEQDTLKRRRMS